MIVRISFLLITLLFAETSWADREFTGRTRFDLERPDIKQWVASAAKEFNLQEAEIYALLAKAEPQPKIIELISKPAEKVAPWWQYRARFITEQRIREGTQFYIDHRERLDRAHADTGVAPEYIVAIIGVETFYGRITGRYRVLDALATLAFDYPPRAPFFRSELAHFMLLAKEESVDPLTALGSYAGAMGAPQFMPSSYRRYAVDGSNDQRRNLFADWDDVIASVANYFAEHGWVRDAQVIAETELDPEASIVADPRNLRLNETIDSLRGKGVEFASTLPGNTAALLIPAELETGPAYRVGFKNFEVITRYNRSVRYAMAVHDLANLIAERVPAASTAPTAPASSPSPAAPAKPAEPAPAASGAR